MYNIENTYLELMNSVLVCGVDKDNRTGIKTRSIHGAMLRHNPDCGFPLLTTKRVPFKSVAAELLWFLSASTDCQSLIDKGCNIWTANAKAWVEQRIKRIFRFLISKGQKAQAMKYLDEADRIPKTTVGRIYGAQWREWNMGDEGQEPLDQIKLAIDMIKNQPESRRILVSAWNAGEIIGYDRMGDNSLMCLPPCHVLHRYAVEDGQLNMTMYQRSVDAPVGLPFNIASYALLNAMMAQVTGLKPGNIVYFLDDVHIYHNHIEQVKEQLSRKNDKKDFPKLKIDPNIKDIDDFCLDHFSIEDYNPMDRIKMEMVV